MSDRFFIGREKEIQQLENLFLRPSSHPSNLRICHLWGREGIGKSSLLLHFSKLLMQESDPIIWVEAVAADIKPDPAIAMSTINQSAQTNISDLEVTAQQVRDTRIQESAPESPSENPNSWKYSILNAIAATQNQTILGSDKLRFILLLDDFHKFPFEARNAIARQIVQVAQESEDRAIISVLISARSNFSESREIYDSFAGYEDTPLEIELENLSRDETYRYLEAHHIDQNESHKIFEHSQGHPKQLALAVASIEGNSEDVATLERKGHQMLMALNNFQRNWIKWAAIMRACNEESISLLADNRETVECLNWIRSNYPVYFDREKADYSLRPEYQKSILAVVKKEEPTVFKQISTVVQKLQTVKNSIPNYNHRRLLSKLSLLHFFDIHLIEKVFDEQTTEEILQLLESKPVFFRSEGDSYRLASNTKSSIQLYNSLIKPPQKAYLIDQINKLWLEKQKGLQEELVARENELHEAEKKNQSLSESLSTVEKEIERISSEAKSVPVRRVVRQKKRKAISPIITSIFFQITGIGILYTETLLTKRISLPYVTLSMLLMVSGFLIGSKSSKQSYVTVTSTQKSQNAAIENMMGHLQLDRATLNEQKERLRSKIESNKSIIIQIQEALRRGYLAEKP